ncbi:hypothetical protein, partial [Streptococcus pneumoniae]|uniref:hypothetical protein n=1 Tax=Streptococcus pneumoniae TaxID=1313 RepID=UPI0012D80355
MNEKNVRTDLAFLSLAQKLLEEGDPKMLQNQLEELKELVIPGSRAQRARYTQLLREVARVAALEELARRD